MVIKPCKTCNTLFECRGNDRYCPGICRNSAYAQRRYRYHFNWVSRNRERVALLNKRYRANLKNRVKGNQYE